MSVSKPVAVAFCTQWEGHLRRLLPVVRGLVREGFEVYVFGFARSGLQVAATGGQMVDLYGRYPLEHADDESVPNSVRHVTHAAVYGTQVIEDVRRLRPALVVYDTFSVIARVVANALGLPAVNVCAGHDLQPARTVARVREDLRVVVSDACHRAVERLRSEFGIEDASPFSYVNGVSRRLNVYCEPPEFLDAASRQVFAPIAFFGSLPSIEYLEQRRSSDDPVYFSGRRSATRLYVSFGTLIWRYYTAEALAAMAAVADLASDRPDLEVVMSLGSAAVPPQSLAPIARANVTIHPRLDQWAILQQAHVFLTHHGLNSTHEAIYQGAPMLSYPFFWDQPAMTATCERLGIGLPLVAATRASLDAASVGRGLDRVAADEAGMRARLAEAREWELRVMAGRRAVIQQIAALAT